MREYTKSIDFHVSLRPFHISLRRGIFLTPKEPTINDLQRHHLHFQLQRPKFLEHDTGQHLVDRLEEEVHELRREVPTTERVLSLQEQQKIAGELSDCLSFVFNIANHYGIDAAIAFYAKMDEVSKRYPPELFQLGDGRTFDESYQEARRRNGH